MMPLVNAPALYPTAQNAMPPDAMRTVMHADLPFAALVRWSDNPRFLAGEDDATVDVRDLMQSIVALGDVMGTLIVFPLSNGRYAIIDGNRRLRAVERLLAEGVALPFTTIHCRIEPTAAGDSPAAIQRRALIAAASNYARREWGVRATVEHFYRMSTEMGVDTAAIARAVGADPQTVEQAVISAAMPPELWGAVEEGRLPYDHLRYLSLAYAARAARDATAADAALNTIWETRIQLWQTPPDYAVWEVEINAAFGFTPPITAKVGAPRRPPKAPVAVRLDQQEQQQVGLTLERVQKRRLMDDDYALLEKVMGGYARRYATDATAP